MKKTNIFLCLSDFKKIMIIFFAILLGCACVITPIAVVSSTKTYTYTVVIDAGHGGVDGGCVGASGISESVLNLEYAKTLRRYFKEYGFNVVMTREDENGLYGAFSKNKKKDDMQKRKQIIQNSGANFVVSIHMNSFPTGSSRGAQVFYAEQNDLSQNLANCIQSDFVCSLVKPRKVASKGDYYILSCTQTPSVLIECGFLSNKEEEQLLLTNDYREKLCYSILCGSIMYLGE